MPHRGIIVRFNDNCHLVCIIISSTAPPLAYTHAGGCMFITDMKPQTAELEDSVDIVELSREGDPYFASVLESKSVGILHDLETSLLEDPGNRGTIHLYQKSQFIKATLALSHARRVAVTTGFPVHTGFEVAEETDGLPGALAICQALVVLGKEVVLICDKNNKHLFESCVEHENKEGGLRYPVKVLPCSEAMETWEAANPDMPPWDCLVAIERAGRAKDNTYRTMSAKTVCVDPVDDIFLKALTNPLVSTIAIGDGGNELGMGKVYEKVVKHICNGPTIACTTPADFIIACGVSNWGGYALSLGLFVVSSSPIHWRYRNNSIIKAQDLPFNRDDFIPTLNQVRPCSAVSIISRVCVHWKLQLVATIHLFSDWFTTEAYE
jgi:hypothetical protein